jgi:hypothetical protein
MSRPYHTVPSLSQDLHSEKLEATIHGKTGLLSLVETAEESSSVYRHSNISRGASTLGTLPWVRCATQQSQLLKGSFNVGSFGIYCVRCECEEGARTSRFILFLSYCVFSAELLRRDWVDSPYLRDYVTGFTSH